jgi:hypothetical protein
MSACALRRWGTACSPSKPPDTGQSKEMEKSLQSMIAERNKQDTMWLPQEKPVSEISKPSTAFGSTQNPPNR